VKRSASGNEKPAENRCSNLLDDECSNWQGLDQNHDPRF
jgi:hypothetical protein